MAGKKLLKRMLYQSSVGLGERVTQAYRGPDEIQPLLGFFHCGCGVVSPVQVRFDLQSQEFIAVCPLHRSPSDEQRL